MNGVVRWTSGLALLLLAACASEPAPRGLPRLGPEDTDPEQGYERPPTLRASDVVPPSILTGPHHHVREEVATDGFFRLYAIESDFGLLEAAGEFELRQRVQEIRAIAALEELAAGADFERASTAAAALPFASRWDLVEAPAAAPEGMPAPAWAEVLAIAERGPDARTPEQSAVRAAVLAFEREKRALSRRLGVTPYALAPRLQRALNRTAWVISAGGFDGERVPALVEDSVAPRPEDILPRERIDVIFQNDAPEDLRRRNRIELAVMGLESAVIEQFLAHPSYSPRQQTGIVESLVTLDATHDRGEYARVALRAASPRDALFYLSGAILLSFHHRQVAPFERLLALEGRIAAGYTEDRRLIVPAAVDFLVWTRPVERFARTFANARPAELPIAGRELWLSGAVSALARREIESLGITVVENVFARVFERLDGGTAPAGTGAASGRGAD